MSFFCFFVFFILFFGLTSEPFGVFDRGLLRVVAAITLLLLRPKTLKSNERQKSQSKKTKTKMSFFLFFLFFSFCFFLITSEPFGVSACSWPRKVAGDARDFSRPRTRKSNDRQKSQSKKQSKKQYFYCFFLFFGLFFPHNFRTLRSFCVFLASKNRGRRP